jgi:hypothetical protein
MCLSTVDLAKRCTFYALFGCAIWMVFAPDLAIRIGPELPVAKRATFLTMDF